MNARSRAKIAPAPRPAEPHQYLTFTSGRETFAVDIMSITEIVEYAELTAVPMLPPSIRGVINLRGEVVPVMDLHARFGRGEAQINRRSCIIMVQTKAEGALGVLVDAVSAVLEIPESAIEPPPSIGGRPLPSFIQGMGKLDGVLVVILDMSLALSAEELSDLAKPLLAPSAADQPDIIALLSAQEATVEPKAAELAGDGPR
jgi:purine-binding chemotaxis protein CheW